MRQLQRFFTKIFYKPGSRQFLVVNNALAALTLISIAALILETVSSLAPYAPLFAGVEYVSVAVFTLEYMGRIIARRKNVFAYMFSFFGLIDLLSIAPTYFGLTNLTYLKSARVLRIMRLLRMVRLAKIARIEHHHRKDTEEYAYLYRLNVRIYFFALLSAVIIFGTLIFIAEGDNAPFASIPLGMLWASKVTLGGIAQFHPTSTFGEIISVLTRFTGLALFGLLITIVGSAIRRLLFGKEAYLDDLSPKRSSRSKH